MSEAFTESLSSISLHLNRIVPIFQIILGTFGNIINILIFSRRSLRVNSCSVYFLASSINSLFILYTGTLTRLLSSGWNIDPSNSSSILCRFRIFFVYTSLCLVQWFVVAASIDRYFSTCPCSNRRRLSTVPIARKIILWMMFIAFSAHFHTLIWWQVDFIGSTTYCNVFQIEYEIFFQVFFLVVSCILPPTLMAIFGILTIWNVRRIQNKVLPASNIQKVLQCRPRSKDRQLLKMLLIQLFATILFTLPFSLVNLTSMIFEYWIVLDDFGSAINSLYSNIGRLIHYFNPVVGFYIYTLSSRSFRSELKSLFRGNIRHMPQNNGLPMTNRNETALTKNVQLSVSYRRNDLLHEAGTQIHSK